MDEKRIEGLYKLLERAKREKDDDAESALCWAIFNLENHISMGSKDGRGNGDCKS